MFRGLPDDLFNTTIRDIDYIDARSREDLTFFKTGFGKIDKWCGGGFRPATQILLAARPNFGKSSILQSLLKNLIKLNENVIVLAISLDDTKSTFLSRWIAGDTECAISTVEDRATRNQDQEERVQESYRKFKIDYARKMMVLDAADIQGKLDNIEAQMKHVFAKVCSVNDKKPQLVVTIDSPRNLNFSHVSGLSANPAASTEYVGRRIKEMLAMEVEGVPVEPIILCTDHLKKLPPGIKRPGPDDIKDSIGPQYDANLILMLWNDLCYCKTVTRTDSDMKFRRDDLLDPRTGECPYDPVVEISLAKNKMGRMDYANGGGIALFKFYQEQSRMVPITSRDEYMSYANLIR